MKFKKFMAALCASVMVLGATMTVCATPSGDTVIKIESTDDRNVYQVAITDEKAKDALQSAANGFAGTSEKATVLASFDLEFEDGKGGTVIFDNLVGVVKGENIKVLHWNGSKWHEVSSKILADGKIEATFNELSPVAIVKVTKTTNDDNNGTTNGKEPGTGVGVSAAALAAAAGLAGVVVLKKKSN